MDKELILKGLPFDTNDDWQQCKLRIIDWLNKNGIKNHCSVYSINLETRSCRVTFLSERNKKSAKGKLAALRKNKGGSKVITMRPEARPYKGDVRDSYKQMKTELYHFWQQICNREGLDYLRVTENVWSRNIFIYQRFSGKGADAKLYYELTDPTNLESWLVFN